MSTLAINDHMPARSTASSLSGLVAEMRAAEPRFMALAIILVLAMLPTGFAALMDTRSFDGIELWEKPLKFEVALAVYLFTLAFFARYVPVSVANARWYRIYSGSVVVAIVVEMVWIGGAAGLGTTSHFNTTPSVGLYPLMGVAAVLLTSRDGGSGGADRAKPRDGPHAGTQGRDRARPRADFFRSRLLTAGTMASDGRATSSAAAERCKASFPSWAGRVTGAICAWRISSPPMRMHAIPLAGLASPRYRAGTRALAGLARSPRLWRAGRRCDLPAGAVGTAVPAWLRSVAIVSIALTFR